MTFSFLDPVLSPILALPPLWGILLISGLLSLLLTLAYKYTTNQTLMKQLKDEISTLQKELKELRQDPDRALHVQKKAMEANMKYMMESLKPTLITFIPIILIFGWLSGHYAVDPLRPGTPFTITASFSGPPEGTLLLTPPEGLNLLSKGEAPVSAGRAQWSMNATTSGKHAVSISYANDTYAIPVRVTSDRTYDEPTLQVKEHGLEAITVDYPALTILNLFGWKLGWLGSYIIFSIFFSLTLRKVLKVY